MIERNIKIILSTVVYVVLINIIATIFVFAKDNRDLLAVFNVAGTLGYLLFINIRAMSIDKIRFKNSLNNKDDLELYKLKKESQRVCWVLLLIQIVICVVICMIVYLG